jgi:hypothetical protein
MLSRQGEEQAEGSEKLEGWDGFRISIYDSRFLIFDFDLRFMIYDF